MEERLDSLELKFSESNNWEEYKEIRLDKITQLHNKLKNYRLEIEELLEQREDIVEQYCEKKGHNYTRVRTIIIGDAKYHSFKDGYVYNIEVTYKCTTCGQKMVRKGMGRPTMFEGEDYNCVIPENLLHFTHPKNDKTFIDLTNELKELLIKEKYVILILEEICRLFGHDATEINDCKTYKCNCCGRTMGEEEYQINYFDAPYKGLVGYKSYFSGLRKIIPTIDLSNININGLEESIVVPGTKLQEIENQKRLRKTMTPKYFDFSKEKSFKLPKGW